MRQNEQLRRRGDRRRGQPLRPRHRHRIDGGLHADGRHDAAVGAAGHGLERQDLRRRSGCAGTRRRTTSASPATTSTATALAWPSITSLSYSYTGLTCGSSYTMALEAYDAAGNVSNRAEASGTTTTEACAPGPDTQAPSAPGRSGEVGRHADERGRSAGARRPTTSASAGYRVYRDGTLVASPTGTTQNVTGLTCGTTYAFGVEALDAAGQRLVAVGAQRRHVRVRAGTGHAGAVGAGRSGEVGRHADERGARLERVDRQRRRQRLSRVPRRHARRVADGDDPERDRADVWDDLRVRRRGAGRGGQRLVAVGAQRRHVRVRAGTGHAGAVGARRDGVRRHDADVDRAGRGTRRPTTSAWRATACTATARASARRRTARTRSPA